MTKPTMKEKDRHEGSWETYLLHVGYPADKYDMYTDYYMWTPDHLSLGVDYEHLIDHIEGEYLEWCEKVRDVRGKLSQTFT